MDKQKQRIVKMGNEEIIVKSDPSLNKYCNIVLFPEKVALCDAAIAKSGLPEAYYIDQERLKKQKKGNS